MKTEIELNGTKLWCFDIPVDTPEWFQFRTVGIPGVYDGGIGASECAKVLGLDHQDYRPSLPELWWQKVGLEPIHENDTIAAQFGHIMEPILKEMWSFWISNADSDIRQAMINMRMHSVDPQRYPRARKSILIKKYIVNPSTPWIFVSLDHWATPGQHSASGEVLEQGFPVESKTIGFFVARQWEDGIPPKYSVQVATQMLTTASRYGELMAFESPTIRLYGYDANSNFENTIKRTTKAFFDSFMEGRKYASEYRKLKAQGRETDANIIYGQLQKMEPDAVPGEAYKEFQTDRMQRTYEFDKGNVQEFLFAKKYNVVSKIIKAMEKNKSLFQNLLLKALVDRRTQHISFFDAKGIQIGHVKKYKNFDCKVDVQIDDAAMNEVLVEFLKKAIK